MLVISGSLLLWYRPKEVFGRLSLIFLAFVVLSGQTVNNVAVARFFFVKIAVPFSRFAAATLPSRPGRKLATRGVAFSSRKHRQ